MLTENRGCDGYHSFAPRAMAGSEASQNDANSTVVTPSIWVLTAKSIVYPIWVTRQACSV